MGGRAYSNISGGADVVRSGHRLARAAGGCPNSAAHAISAPKMGAAVCPSKHLGG